MAILKEKVGITKRDLVKLRAMRPGMALDLQLVAPNGIKRVKTEFIGMDGMRCLIIKFPDESRWGNLRDAIYADNSMVVRYILEEDAGEVVAFKVKINLVLSRPGNYIFTGFPLSIQCHALRSEERAQAHVPVSVRDSSTTEELCDGMIVDLSLSGCRVSLDRGSLKEKLPQQAQITLNVRLPDGNYTELTGKVMNQKVEPLKHFLGIKFDAEEGVVGDLLHQLMLTPT